MTNPYRSPNSSLEIGREVADYSDLPALVRPFARVLGTRLPWARRVARGIAIVLVAWLASWGTGLALSALLVRLMSASMDPQPDTLVARVVLYSVPVYAAWGLLTLAGAWTATCRPEVTLDPWSRNLRLLVRVLAVSGVVAWVAFTVIRAILGFQWTAGEDPMWKLRWIRVLPELVNLVGTRGLAIAGLAYLALLAQRLRGQGLFVLGVAASGLYALQWLAGFARAVADPTGSRVVELFGQSEPVWRAVGGILDFGVSLFALVVMVVAYRFFNRGGLSGARDQ
jgi:hypothetical protein